MLLIIENGRLGNQLFQYNFIKKIQKRNEKVFFIGFDALSKIINKKNNYFIKNTLSNIFIKYRSYLIKLLKKINLFNLIYEDNKKKIIKNYGFFKSITLVDGFFSNPKIVNKNFFSRLNINIDPQIISNNFQNSYFVHVRRGDYFNWPSKNFNAFINDEWYLDCIKKIQIKNDEATFYLFSDNISQIRNKKLLKICKVLNLDQIDTFKFMCNCEGGILSASTYSWWAAFISRHIVYSKCGIYYAPNYWAGFKKKKFYPKSFKFNTFLKFENILTK